MAILGTLLCSFNLHLWSRVIYPFFLAELIWFKSYFIFILQAALMLSITIPLYYKLGITLSVLFPPCTLVYCLYCIERVGLHFVSFYLSLLSGIFSEAQTGIFWISSVNFNQWKLIFPQYLDFTGNAYYKTRRYLR